MLRFLNDYQPMDGHASGECHWVQGLPLSTPVHPSMRFAIRNTVRSKKNLCFKDSFDGYTLPFPFFFPDCTLSNQLFKESLILSKCHFKFIILIFELYRKLHGKPVCTKIDQTKIDTVDM